MAYLSGKRIAVTGGDGFLGRVVCQRLASYQPSTVFVPRSCEYDLRDRESIRRMLLASRPDVVIHLAADSDRNGSSCDAPGRVFYHNAVMGIELIEQSRLLGVEKLVLVGSLASYPERAVAPLREADLWSGFPAEIDAPLGNAKKMLFVQADAYRRQYGFKAIALLMADLYGPGDDFGPRTSRTVPVLVRRVVEAQRNEQELVEIPCSGQPTRDLLFVTDAADAIATAADRYDENSPINIGSGREVMIRDLARQICRLCGFRGHVRWSKGKLDGPMRRRVDNTRAARELDFLPKVALAEGLARTIDWYRQQSSDQDGFARAA